MSNTRNQCDGVGHATKSAISLDRDFAQLTQSYQAHGGEVNTGTTPQVQYSYADGSSNTIRITGMTYPNGRNVVDDYGTTGSMNDAASRIFGMKDSGASSNLVEYSYLGLSGFVKTVYPVSGTQYTLVGTTGGTNPDSGDIYLGLDRFGRVIDANWANVAGTATLARVKYGYNRVSSRTWRDNLSPGMTGFDELYGYDQLQRLQGLGRGTLNGTQTAITSPTFGQDWTLDETGNWKGFKQDNTGSGTWNLDQSRTANTVNEITSLVNETSKAWTTPAYDKAGNMTRIPVPGTLPDGVAWNPMTLSDWDNLKLADWEEMTLDNVEGVYDAWNRLVRLHVGDTTLAEYTYDARGYHIRKDSYTDGTLDEQRHYYYTPGWQVVEERVDSSTTADRQFVWGLRYIDDLVLRDRDTDGNGVLDERRYCLQDGNWNTIALTSTSGSVTERFSYDAYGVPTFLTDTGTVQPSSATGWETLYAGYRWDGDPSRMYDVRNRFLLPYAGTWNRRDPIGHSAGMSLLEVVNSGPTTAVDSFGLQRVWPLKFQSPEFRTPEFGTAWTIDGESYWIDRSLSDRWESAGENAGFWNYFNPFGEDQGDVEAEIRSQARHIRLNLLRAEHGFALNPHKLGLAHDNADREKILRHAERVYRTIDAASTVTGLGQLAVQVPKAGCKFAAKNATADAMMQARGWDQSTRNMWLRNFSGGDIARELNAIDSASRMHTLNLGGEGEFGIGHVLNQQPIERMGSFINDFSSRGSRPFSELMSEGHRFDFTPNKSLPYSDGAFDRVYTNSVPINSGGNPSWGNYDSKEIKRVLSPGGRWINVDSSGGLTVQSRNCIK